MLQTDTIAPSMREVIDQGSLTETAKGSLGESRRTDLAAALALGALGAIIC
jgi:hypothetical protein